MIVANFATPAANSAPLVLIPVRVIPVVKRVTPGVIALVVVDYVMVIPIASPMTPTPSPPAEPTDSEADSSEPQIRAVVPNSGIRVPSRPRYDRTTINYPRIVGGNVNDFGTGRLNNDRLALRRHVLLRCGLQIAGFLRPPPHHLHRIHHILLLVVIGVA